jgi:hypothetical protein
VAFRYVLSRTVDMCDMGDFRVMQVRRPEGYFVSTYPIPPAVPDEARLVAYRYPHTLDILPSIIHQRHPAMSWPANRVRIMGWPFARDHCVVARREEVRDDLNPPLQEHSFETSSSYLGACYIVTEAGLAYVEDLMA